MKIGAPNLQVLASYTPLGRFAPFSKHQLLGLTELFAKNIESTIYLFPDIPLTKAQES